MKVDSMKVRHKDLESTSRRQERSTKANGTMINLMERVDKPLMMDRSMIENSNLDRKVVMVFTNGVINLNT